MQVRHVPCVNDHVTHVNELHVTHVNALRVTHVNKTPLHSRLLKIICLFCKRALQKRRYSANETYNFKEPTSRSHPIHM